MMCERWEPGIGDPEGVQRCEAFPRGIPSEIWDGGFDHSKPFAPSNKILFRKRADVTDEDVAQWEREYVQQVLVPRAEASFGHLTEEEPPAE